MDLFNPTIKIITFLFLLPFISSTSGLTKAWELKAQDSNDPQQPYVGINVGTDVSNLLSPSELVSFLQLQKITHIRLYEADSDILRALAGTKIQVIVGIPNNQLLALGSSNTTAASWVARNVAAYYPTTLISAIAVGDEVLSSLPSTAPLLVPAMEFLYSALVSANLHHRIMISAPHSASIILDPFPPSQAFFNSSLNFVLQPLLSFLSRTGSPLMMNFYPYYVFMQNRGLVPIENSLFKPLTPAKEEVDPNTLLHYTNVLDAMIDAAYFSMKNLNVTDVPVLVTESGWPSKGDKKEPYATMDNANTYNSNLIKHVLDRSGTPLYPERTSSVYIYELFNEDMRPEPVSEANWGLFYGNTTAVYLLHVSGSGDFLANDTTNRTFCVAVDGVDKRMLQAALDWACGPGRANCSDIQPGEDCYEPNTVKNHASYAFDSYYHMEGQAAGSCDFKGVAIVTTTDPSHGSCIFPGSKKVGDNANVTRNATDSSISKGWRLRCREEKIFQLVILLAMLFISTFFFLGSSIR
ncbi:glucan endo-1,3-beta-glucosidase 1 [Cinnamomum micranthum f. kanehirae]|uniref:glucan endo-1,3-beta-D-glucosidase n=1 Tax=Cinnamomum micranthum f. kanehirae TaxID=337451 RepID=A0A3S3NQ72_9MAGN|nr:glucan endo-1,3-beta-glucosidase 1 [Cinnamomum micranthum f. kanehirae]